MDILLIQILRLGDALQLVPVVKGIRHYFPDARLSVLTSKIGADILGLFTGMDEIFALDKETINPQITSGNGQNRQCGMELLASQLSTVLAKRWDWTINLSHTVSAALICFLADAAHKTGLIANRHRQYIAREKWFSFSLASFMHRRYSNFNWVDINRYMLGLDSLPPPPYVSIPEKVLDKTRSGLSDLGMDHRPIVGLCPGASVDNKRWPLEKFGILGKHLVTDHGKQILIFGDQKEKDIARQVREIIGPGAVSVAGETDIEALMNLLSLCEVLVTNDTGPMHLASAVGTPVVALFFTTHHVETGPYGAGHIALHPDLPCYPCQGTAACDHHLCLKGIRPETVLSAVLKIIRKDRDPLEIPLDDQGRVKGVMSRYDPWGNLEWQPITRDPLRFEDLERLLLKRAWLDFCGANQGNGSGQAVHIPETLKDYNLIPDSTAYIRELSEFRKKQDRFNTLLTDAQKITIALQTRLINGGTDTAEIRTSGEQLQQIEARMTDLGGSSALSFLNELLSQFQENLEKTDPIKLSIKTAETYRSLTQITGSMTRRSEELERAMRSGW